PRASGPAWRRRRLAPARARAAPCTAARTDPETAAPLRPTGTDRGATARGGGGLRRGAHPIDRGNDDVREILHARAARAAREAREALGEERIREVEAEWPRLDRKSTRLNSSHVKTSYAVFCLKKKNGLVESSFAAT